MYAPAYTRWKTSAWGKMKIWDIQRKQPSYPPGIRYKRAIEIAEGRDPDTVYKPESLEPKYEAEFLKEVNLRVIFNKGKK